MQDAEDRDIGFWYQIPHDVPDDLAGQYQQFWAAVAEPFAQVWLELQTELAGFSSNGTLVIAEESGYEIQHDQPDLVIDALRQVAKAGQRSLPLSPSRPPWIPIEKETTAN